MAFETEAEVRTAEVGASENGVEANDVHALAAGNQPAVDESGSKVFRASQREQIVDAMDLIREFHGESRYARLPFSERKFIRFFSKSISNPQETLAIFIQQNGKTVGALIASVADYYLVEGGRMVTVHAVHVSKSIRHSFLGGRVGVKLMRIAGAWVRAQEAEELHVHSTSGVEVERTDKLLRRLGFKAYGGNYAGSAK